MVLFLWVYYSWGDDYGKTFFGFHTGGMFPVSSINSAIVLVIGHTTRKTDTGSGHTTGLICGVGVGSRRDY